MAKIPSAIDVPIRKFEGQSRIATRDISHVGKGVQYLAEGLSQGTEAPDTRFFQEIAKNHEKQQYTKAATDSNLKLTELENSYRDRTDWENFDEEVEEKTTEIISNNAANIRDPDLRQQYVEKMSLAQQRVKQRIGNRATDLWRSEERVSLVKDMEGTAEAMSSVAPSEMGRLYADLEERTEVALEQGILSNAEEAENLMTTYRHMGYTNAFKSLNHKEQGELIKGEDPNFEKLPFETREQLKTMWREDDIDYAAQDFVDNLPVDVDLDTIYEKASQIEDLDKREEATRRAEIAYNQQERVQKEQRIAINEKWSQRIMATPEERQSLSQLRQENPDEWNAMGDSNRRNLAALEKSVSGGGDVKTDPAFALQLFQLQEQGTDKAYQEIARLLNEESAGRLSRSDLEKWGRVAVQGPEAADSGLTDQQLVAGKLAIMEGVPKQAKAAVMGKIGDYRLRFQQKYGKEPTDQQVRDFTDLQLIELRTKESAFGFDYLWPDTVERGYEVTGDRQDVLNTVGDFLTRRGVTINNEVVSSMEGIVDSLTQQGIKPTDANIEQELRRLRRNDSTTGTQPTR